MPLTQRGRDKETKHDAMIAMAEDGYWWRGSTDHWFNEKGLDVYLKTCEGDRLSSSELAQIYSLVDTVVYGFCRRRRKLNWLDLDFVCSGVVYEDKEIKVHLFAWDGHLNFEVVLPDGKKVFDFDIIERVYTKYFGGSYLYSSRGTYACLVGKVTTYVPGHYWPLYLKKKFYEL